MRRFVDRQKLERFMQEFARRVTSPGTVYIAGGATALLLGIREQTIDIDLKLEPEPGGAFEAIAELKNELEVNVELAAPDDFIPPLPGWRERSPFIMDAGKVAFRHYDLYGQALAKLERGYATDLTDAQSLVARGLVDPVRLREMAESILPQLIRYPALDSASFVEKLRRFLEETNGVDSGSSDK